MGELKVHLDLLPPQPLLPVRPWGELRPHPISVKSIAQGDQQVQPWGCCGRLAERGEGVCAFGSCSQQRNLMHMEGSGLSVAESRINQNAFLFKRDNLKLKG